MKRHLIAHNTFLLRDFLGTCSQQEDVRGETAVQPTSVPNILGRVHHAEQQPPSTLWHRVQGTAWSISYADKDRAASSLQINKVIRSV